MPAGYVLNIFDRYYRRWGNPNKEYYTHTISEVFEDKCTDSYIVCTLVDRYSAVSPKIKLSFEQLNAWTRRYNKIHKDE